MSLKCTFKHKYYKIIILAIFFILTRWIRDFSSYRQKGRSRVKWARDCSRPTACFINLRLIYYARLSFAELVAQDNQTLVFPQDIALDKISCKLYVLSNNLARFMFDSYNPSETNFFITSMSLNKLTSMCEHNPIPKKPDRQGYMIFPDMIFPNN